MAIIEIREHAFLGADAGGRTIPAPREPALAVHRPDTIGGAQTVGPFSAQTFLIQISTTPAVDIKYEIAPSNPDSAAGAKRGVILAAALPFSIPVEPGHSIEVDD